MGERKGKVQKEKDVKGWDGMEVQEKVEESNEIFEPHFPSQIFHPQDPCSSS